MYSDVLLLDNLEHMFDNVIVATLVRAVALELNHMDYKKLIIEMLDKADDRRLRLIYVYVKAILGLS